MNQHSDLQNIGKYIDMYIGMSNHFTVKTDFINTNNIKSIEDILSHKYSAKISIIKEKDYCLVKYNNTGE